MTKIDVDEAVKQFTDILDRVIYQNQSYEIVRGDEVVARLVPASPSSPIRADELNAF